MAAGYVSNQATVAVTLADLRVLALCTMRYALGRRSYITGDACHLIRLYRPHLGPHNVAMMANEITTELDRAEAQGRTVGDQIDHDLWRGLARDLMGGR